ncbi:MAG: hypothetical protein ACRBB0_04050 [Pelagimonas sp.]|uniref:hypothetical protein n=1 Tax=Pelagimonas sp. TaxID=2073170 RepID=UPI003D6BC085
MTVVRPDLKDGYTISDWVNIHDFDTYIVEFIASNIRLKTKKSRNTCTTPFPNMSAQEAWSLTSQALAPALPAHLDDVLATCDFTEKKFDAPLTDPPVTMDRDSGKMPLVSMCYQGTPADMLCVAHEFGHALQYHLARGRFVPPVARELAAFVSERIFLDFIRKNKPQIFTPLHAAWQKDNYIYLGTDAEQLRDALKLPSTPYTYRMNYPIARHIVDEAFEPLLQDRLSEIFQGTFSVSECLSKQMTQIEAVNVNNYLPIMTEAEDDCDAINAYRCLGMMTLLDIEYSQGESEKSIGEYYSTRLGHMQTQTAFVAIDEERRPFGYAIWDVDQRDANKVRLKRQSAPFGDHLELQKKLQARLPENATVLSHHFGSAREEQIAW